MNLNRIPKRKASALLAVAMIAAATAWIVQARRNIAALKLSPSASYLFAGGAGYLVLAPNRWGGLNTTEGVPVIGPEIWMGSKQEMRMVPALSGKNLELRIIGRQADSSGQRSEFLARLSLTASATRPGDWDLNDASMSGKTLNSEGFFSKSNFKNLSKASNLAEFDRAFFNALRGVTLLSAEYDPKAGPLLSFLHRIDDPKLAIYYKSRLGGEPDANALSLIRELDAAHPGDEWLLPQLAELEVRAGDLAQAESAWSRLASIGSKNPLLAPAIKIAQANLESARMRKSHPDLEPFSAIFPESDSFRSIPAEWTLERRLEWLRKAGHYDGLLHSDQRTVFPMLASGYSGITVPNFLDLQITAKVAGIEATLALLAGRGDESREWLAGAYRLGQSLNAEGVLIHRLIGLAIRAIAIGGLETYAYNACQTPEDLARFNDMLAFLERTPGQETGPNLLEGERSPLMRNMIFDSRYTPNLLEALTRHTAADAKWAILRTGTAGWGKHLAEGHWPATASDFSTWLPAGIPADPFATPNPIKFRADGDDFLVWSVGPDKKDDSAAIIYDPSNGTVSAGDILTRIPAKPAYPFPKGGVKAESAAQLLAQFPNGLPADPFAYVFYRPLSILDSTTTQPLTVFSWGPNRDESRAISPSVSMSAAGKKGLDLQLVFKRGIDPTISPASGTLSGADPKAPLSLLALEPMYDPTNGTVSQGDLFLEIPRR